MLKQYRIINLFENPSLVGSGDVILENESCLVYSTADWYCSYSEGC